MAEHAAVTAFRRYLRINTVQPKPDYAAAVAFLTGEAEKCGLSTRVVECVAGKPHLLMTLPGKDPTLPSVLLTSHMDVVPVERSKWTRDPFAAEKTTGGFIYGRGAQDMKCVGIQYLYAVKALVASQTCLLRNVHLIYTPDEEIGSADGMKAFVETPEFRQLNVGFSLDEGMASPNERCEVFVGERAPQWCTVTANGLPGHGSTLLDGTAMEKMIAFLGKCSKFRNEQRGLLDQGKRPGEVTSLNVTIIQGGTQHNVIPSEVSAALDIRIPPTSTVSDTEKMVTSWTDKDFHVNWVQQTPTTISSIADAANPWWAAFTHACGRANIELSPPSIFPAATDSRFLRLKGVAAIGMSPINNTPVLLHDHDEYLSEDVFLHGLAAYGEIIPALANVEPF